MARGTTTGPKGFTPSESSFRPDFSGQSLDRIIAALADVSSLLAPFGGPAAAAEEEEEDQQLGSSGPGQALNQPFLPPEGDFGFATPGGIPVSAPGSGTLGGAPFSVDDAVRARALMQILIGSAPFLKKLGGGIDLRGMLGQAGGAARDAGESAARRPVPRRMRVRDR